MVQVRTVPLIPEQTDAFADCGLPFYWPELPQTCNSRAKINSVFCSTPGQGNGTGVVPAKPATSQLGTDCSRGGKCETAPALCPLCDCPGQVSKELLEIKVILTEICIPFHMQAHILNV